MMECLGDIGRYLDVEEPSMLFEFVTYVCGCEARCEDHNKCRRAFRLYHPHDIRTSCSSADCTAALASSLFDEKIQAAERRDSGVGMTKSRERRCSAPGGTTNGGDPPQAAPQRKKKKTKGKARAQIRQSQFPGAAAVALP